MRGEWRSAAADLGGHSHVAAPARQGESAKPFEALTAQQRRSVQHGPRPRHWPGMALAQHGTGHGPRPQLPADLGSRSGHPHAARHPARRSIARSVYLARRGIGCAAVRPLRAVCATLQRRRRSAKSRGSAGDCGRAARALVNGRNGRTRARAYMECEILRPPQSCALSVVWPTGGRCVPTNAFSTPAGRAPLQRLQTLQPVTFQRYNRFKKTRPIARTHD
jgi:hypothetical protein